MYRCAESDGVVEGEGGGGIATPLADAAARTRCNSFSSSRILLTSPSRESLESSACGGGGTGWFVIVRQAADTQVSSARAFADWDHARRHEIPARVLRREKMLGKLRGSFRICSCVADMHYQP